MAFKTKGFQFRCKKNTITAICICGEELFEDYQNSDNILKCPKCKREYDVDSFLENTHSFIRSLLEIFPKSIRKKEPTIEDSPDENLFWMFSHMIRVIKEWKRKAQYYDNIREYTKNWVTEIYHNCLIRTPQLDKILTDLVFSIYYENNEQNKELKIY